MSKETTNRTAVPGLDFLLAHPDFLQNHKPYKVLYLPKTYVPKLIELRREDPLDRRYEVLLNALSAALSDPESEKSLTIRPTDDDTVNEYKPTWHEYQTLGVAKAMSPHPVILTYDSGLRALALQHDLRVEAPLAKYYSGRRKVKVPLDVSQFFGSREISLADWRHNYPNEPALQPNEFVELEWPEYGQTASHFQNLRRYDAHTRNLLPLKYLTHRPSVIQGIFPQNVGQAMLFDALLAPPEEVPIVIVSGAFGTGKTFLSVAAAFSGVHTGEYNHIYICPRDAKLGDEIGAVPGDTDDKVQTKARSIEDSLRDLFRLTYRAHENPTENAKKGKKKKGTIKDTIDYNAVRENPQASSAFQALSRHVDKELADNFTFIPMIEIGGRSLSHSFIICDEFQDTNPLQARAMITRLGNHSKIVLLGDLTQVNNPELSTWNNGLRYAIDHLAGKPEIVYLNLANSEIVRHPVTLAIAKYLS